MPRPTQNITERTGGQPQAGISAAVVSPGLTLVKQPRQSHPSLTALVQLLARQTARREFARQLSARSDRGDMGRRQ
ncbi:MAG: hypothetical protein ACJAUW_000008 [Yoonia sp.]|jgi:hypothetical protein